MEKDENRVELESAWSKQRVPQKSINREAGIQTETPIILALDIYYRTFHGGLEQTLSKFESCQNPQGHAKHIFSASLEHLVDPMADTVLEDPGRYLHGL